VGLATWAGESGDRSSVLGGETAHSVGRDETMMTSTTGCVQLLMLLIVMTGG